jgi:superfamily I DNA/RNA helicase
MINRSPFEFSWDRLTFNSFHGFCYKIFKQFNTEWPTSSDDLELFFRETVPNAVARVIKDQEYSKYDAILIDEGQDYQSEWYDLLKKFLTNHDELVVVCDKNQNIYGRSMEWIDKRKRGFEKFGEWINLKTVIRMPRGVTEISKKFSSEFNLDQELKVGNVQRPDLFNQYIEHIRWENIYERNWLKEVDSAFELMNSNATSKHLSDTVILLPDKIRGMECVKHFENVKKIVVNHVFQTADDTIYNQHKKGFWMGNEGLKISTIHCFKGWEALNIILYIPATFMGRTEQNDMRVYSAITRSRQNLIVINANRRYWSFGEEIIRDKMVTDNWQ